jgi:zinc transporter 1
MAHKPMMSRSARITLLLVIDVFFFFVELIVGYAVGSLALVADSFHMLNDVMSLIVALYAIKLTAQSATDSRYSYGWHRAEILAALINGVFLLALCFSIFLEAIERFFNTAEISNPKLVVVVGSLGLASNIVGLFLFHEHSHSHGQGHSHGGASVPASKPASIILSDSSPADTTLAQKIPQSPRSRTRSDSYSFSGHPVATRASLVQVAQDIALATSPPKARKSLDHMSSSSARLTTHASQDDLQHGNILRLPKPVSSSPTTDQGPSEHTPLLHDESYSSTHIHDSSSSEGNALVHDQTEHNHGHGHSQPQSGSMNMRALLLHVLGDALGNVGVIATGLVIWLSTWSFKYYFDPVISLVITVIIFSSALPLVRSASFILLQGVPSTVSIEEVRASILEIEGVLSLHELHIWQLSESKIIASVHVLASRDHDFMPVAAKIRKALHLHGIHSSTIQPEYYHTRTEDYLKTTEETSCLITCPPDQACDPSENACCPPPPSDV